MKCKYSFQYPITKLIGKNNDKYIRLTSIERQETPPVKYNNDKYDVVEVRMYQPSLHRYGGKKVDAEIQINHANRNGTSNLMVCVPIIAGNEDTDVNKIINEMSKKAPTKGMSTEISLSTFTLNHVVPKEPFYSYSGSHPDNCSSKFEYIVFKKENGIQCSSVFKNLSKMITKSAHKMYTPKEGVFLNANGPSYANDLGDDIYIDCQPTGSDGEVIVKTPTPSVSWNFGNINMNFMDNDVVKIIMGIVLMLIIISIIRYGFGYFKRISLTRNAGVNR